MTATLLVYLELERLAYRFDTGAREDAADLVRDLMDGVWMSLTDEEKQLLNARGDEPADFVGRVTLGHFDTSSPQKRYSRATEIIRARGTLRWEARP